MTDSMLTLKLKLSCHQNAIRVSAIKREQTGLRTKLQYQEKADDRDLSMHHFDVALVIVDGNKFRDGKEFDGTMVFLQ